MYPDDEVLLMAGDVASAYRNACTHSECVYMFCGYLPEDSAIVIDMSAAFGWTGSAGTYSVLGGAVAYMHGQISDPDLRGFFNYHWVDDHVNVTSKVGSRCADIDQSLRFAMTSVMEPAAVNEEKVTPWRSRQKVLGLIFDTHAETVSMPAEKISKAKRLVAHAFHTSSLSRSAFRSLLGSLRHVATCVRPAQAFLQRLRVGERQLHRRSRVEISAQMRDDLTWWWHILTDSSLNGVPMQYFSTPPPQPHFVVSTDASDDGVCALVQCMRLSLTYQFTPTEQNLIAEFKAGADNAFDINYRELLSCAFTVQAWAAAWRTTQPQYLREHSVADSSLRRYADSSLRRYAGSFTLWKRWIAQRRVNWRLDVARDRSLQLLSEFIIDCSQHGCGSNQAIRSSTVKATLFGVRHFIRAAGGEFPIDYPQIRMLLKGVARFDAPSKHKAPVSIAVLEACFHTLNLHDPADQAMWGMLCLAYFFLLRRSEIMATTKTKFQWFALNGNDVTVIDSTGSPTTDPCSATAECIHLRGFKTNQNGKAVVRMLTRSGHRFICPVIGALLIAQARNGLPPGIPAAVFIGNDGRPGCVSAARATRVLKAGARAVGDDPERFGTHSLRAGGATSMYHVGVDQLTIQFHGRWVSDAFKLYTRLCSDSVAKVASRIVSGSRSSTVLQ